MAHETTPVQYLTVWDFLLTPIYLLILVNLAKQQANKRYPSGHVLRPYFLRGLYVKLGGAIFIGLIYQYYYGGGGDTFHYFEHAKIVNTALDDSLSTWFKLILHQPVDSNPELYRYTSQMYWYNDLSTYTVVAIASILGLFNGTLYLPIALLFAYISYTGIWAMYRTFINIYPKLYKELAVAFLFIPSTFVWGSAIFKDTVCMFGLGWLTYTSFRIIVNRDFSLRNLLLLSVSFYLLATIKLYILLAFLPALSLWILLTYSHRIKTAGVRWLINIGFVFITVFGFFFFTKQFAAEMNKYSLERVAATAATTRSWIGYVSDVENGSGYDLGDFEPSLVGMLSKFPQAVVVTLFRPFLWEARKVIVILSALEGLVFLYFTLRIFLKRPRQAIKLISSDPTVLFCLVFALIFAFAVGVTSYNFGALSRYKIPCMPFYATFLAIVYNREKPNPKLMVRKAKPKPQLAT